MATRRPLASPHRRARATHLIDKSALARARVAQVGDRIEALRDAERLASCSIVDLEMTFSARSPADHESVRRSQRLLFARVPIDQDVLDRAEEVQALLARDSRHRGATIPDLVIAAAAERAGLTVLHYDADYDLIAEVTGQAVEWVVERGSVP